MVSPTVPSVLHFHTGFCPLFPAQWNYLRSCSFSFLASSFFLPLDRIINTIQICCSKKKKKIPLTHILPQLPAFLCSSFNKSLEKVVYVYYLLTFPHSIFLPLHLFLYLLQSDFHLHQSMKPVLVKFTSCPHMSNPKFRHSQSLTYSTIIHRIDHYVAFLISF